MFNFLKSKKKLFLLIIIFIIICLLILSFFDIMPKSFDLFFFPDGKILTNLKNFFFYTHAYYIFYMIFSIKDIFLILVNFILIFFLEHRIYNVDNFIFNLNDFFLNAGFENIFFFYYSNFSEYKMLCEFFSNNPFFNNWKNVFYRSNLPIFFFFLVLFIISTVSSLFLLSYLGFYGVFFINLITIFFFWLSLIFYFNIFFLENTFYKLNLGKWFSILLNYPVYFELYIDVISYSFMFLTTTIAVCVYTYSFSYFRYEPNVERLILFINLFVISMICLVISGNFFVFFLGWELIGLTSFFLINFWSTRISTLKSAFKAFVFNKFSDVSLLISILLLFFCTNNLSINIFNINISNYNNYYIHINNYKFSLIEVLSFFLITSAFIKSAQFGFHIWLPDSMEAPVPASALIHSATLVSAGIFILLRFSQLFEYSLYAYFIIPFIGSFTAFFGGLCAVYQSDIKKILAYSTISHCGFLMVSYSSYITEYTILYLYVHGFFKAAVFLCVGNIIRFSRNYQDFRKMGGYWKYLPFECFASFICLINLSGIPFSLGFYIKHFLIIGIFTENIFNYFFLINILGGAIFGLIYSYKLFFYVFFDFKKNKKIVYNYSNRNNLKSYVYSNSTLASNISILFLIVVSYIISLYLLKIFLNFSSIGEGLDIYSVYSSQIEEYDYLLFTTNNNISYFNWILILIIIIIVLSSWRLVFKYNIVFNILSTSIIFILFFFFFYSVLI